MRHQPVDQERAEVRGAQGWKGRGEGGGGVIIDKSEGVGGGSVQWGEWVDVWGMKKRAEFGGGGGLMRGWGAEDGAKHGWRRG